MPNLDVDGEAHFFRPAINSINRRPGHQPTRQAFRVRLSRPIPAGIRRAPDASARCVLRLQWPPVVHVGRRCRRRRGSANGAIRQRARPSISHLRSPFVSCRNVWAPSTRASPPPPRLNPNLQLPLLLQHLQLQPLHAILQRLLPPSHHLGAQRGFPVQPLPALAHRRRIGCGCGHVRQPPGVQVGARLERLDPPRLARQVLVGAVEEERDEGADFVAEGGFCGGEGGVGD